jgi:HAD superfamily hydrolase (TIGR01509 family)
MPAEGPAEGHDDGPADALAAVLFDMDGLLVDTEHCWLVAERAVMTWLGHPYWSEEEQGLMLGGPLSRVAEYMKETSGSDRPAQEIERHLVQTMADLLADGADHRPGAESLLDDLQANGVPCALVSSSPRNLVDAVLASVGGAHFTTTIAGDEVARTKPFPDPYLLACSRLGVEPARAVVLEDSPVGVAAAEAAGCFVVAVPFVVPIEPAPRRHVVSSLADLDTIRLRGLVAEDLGRATRS